MKKIFAICLAFAVASISVNAQTTKVAPKKEEAKKVVTDAKQQATKTVVAPVKAAAPTGTPKKADGTPDMRYKENKGKTAAAPAGPKKADGTLDMRYKENKKAAPAKKKG